MTSATVIRTIEITPLDIPLLSPFGISGGVKAVANNALVAIELVDGTWGYGEAAPLPPYNGETQANALSALRRSQGWLVGRDVRAWRTAATELHRQADANSGSAQCALETAMLDALCRHEGTSLWKYFGGAGTELETDMTVTTGSVDEATAATRAILSRGIRIIKVKIGGSATVEEDRARIGVIHEVAPESPLILDGNTGLSRASARELVRGLKADGITPALLEQWLPKDDLDGMRALRLESGWLVAADESVTTAEEARRVAQAGAADVINIKLMKSGVAVALEIVEVARTSGLGLMIGGNLESILAMTMSACFAAGKGGFRFADLDTPLFLATNPFTGGFTMEGGRISVRHLDAGHGVTPR